MFKKTEVGFEHPAKGPDHCSECVHFEKRGPHTCEIVAGKIEGTDWCRKFREKSMAKKSKKVRRIEIEKVKSGDGKRLHKVTASYHDQPAQSGKGFSAAMPSYQPPEETYHTSHAKAKKHVHQLMGQMTAGPEDEPDGDEANEPEEDNEPV